MIKIVDFIPTGKENAVTARDLSVMLNCSPRAVTKRIERERDEGAPICACTDAKKGGYFLAEDITDFNIYCGQLDHRIKQIQTTRKAIKETARQFAEGVYHG